MKSFVMACRVCSLISCQFPFVFMSPLCFFCDLASRIERIVVQEGRNEVNEAKVLVGRSVWLDVCAYTCQLRYSYLIPFQTKTHSHKFFNDTDSSCSSPTPFKLKKRQKRKKERKNTKQHKSAISSKHIMRINKQ